MRRSILQRDLSSMSQRYLPIVCQLQTLRRLRRIPAVRQSGSGVSDRSQHRGDEEMLRRMSLQGVDGFSDFIFLKMLMKVLMVRLRE
mmetsp:Transcript_21040/g.32789  ORF Transcript_21040/g.32789 Transcript_21040/m.32789 type:complete len:87 (+) Transcript_21040:2557-2817(+)